MSAWPADGGRAWPPRAVLLDALGTLVELEPPAPLLVRELRARFGLELDERDAAAALRAEIAYYRANHDQARDAASLADVRRHAAAALRDALPSAAADLPLEPLTEALLAALRFRPYPEAPEVLSALRAAGRRLVVVSNWDVSLHEVLARTGLAPLLDGALTSAEVGCAKPEPAIFARALALAGVDAAEAVHVGDSVEHDVAGARAAGIEPLLLARTAQTARGFPPPAPIVAPPGVRVVETLRPLLDP